MNTGARIKELRTQVGMTQVDLADKIGCSSQVISNIERNCTRPTPEILRSISEIFNVPADDILKESDNGRLYLSDDEKNIVLSYRKLSPADKKTLQNMITAMLT